ncbi:MAG: M50 family metallopeptidase [Kofleriaceae bacterium]|nr:M50 family metallopeptidase [Kofleriaceae bacterium]
MYYLLAVAALGLFFKFGYLSAIMALAFLIVVHEGGHYFVARWFGMRVDRFSIGFGPGIFKKTDKRGTTFQLAPLPFGGFVEIKGMNILEEVDPEDANAYPNKPAWQRFLTIFAGPATNYLSAIVLAFGLYTCHGVPANVSYYAVSDVMADFDATDKLKPDDRILAVDGTRIFANQLPSLTELVSAKNGAPVTLTIQRDGKEQDVAIKPVMRTNWWTDETFYLLGITRYAQTDTVKIGVGEAAKRALVFPVVQTRVIVDGLAGIFKGTEKADPGGPKRILDEFKRAFGHSIVAGIELLMMLSVYLGLFNLFPLPALDGGRLVFLGYELITRRRPNPKIEATIHMGGIMVLLVVMVLVTLRDFKLL